MPHDPSSDPAVVLPDPTPTVLLLLLLPEHPRPWSVWELALEIGDPERVEDALSRLHGAGLAHRCGEFVWATHAAVMADALTL